MTLEKAAKQLQDIIDPKMKAFAAIGTEAKETRKKLDEMHLQMAKILRSLKPVSALIRAQHPDKCNLFDELLNLLEDNNEK